MKIIENIKTALQAVVVMVVLLPILLVIAVKIKLTEEDD